METQSPPRVTAPSILAMARVGDSDHVPSISSPLNPNTVIDRSKPPKAAPREQREKKESLKKRESAVGHVKAGSPPKKVKHEDVSGPRGLPSPIRYNHKLPKEHFYYMGPKEPIFTSHEPDPIYIPGTQEELRRPTDHAENKKAFRYTHCVADPTFPHTRYYRQTDGAPYGPRMSFEDSDKWFHFNDAATVITNDKGWRMGRGNVCAREGSFYYEVKILRGVPRDGTNPPARTGNASPYIRMGWARREAHLDAPPGFDGYSYGLSDVRFEPMHRSRASKFLDDGTDRKPTKRPVKGKPPSSTEFAVNEPACESDVIGLEIRLPSLAFHRKIADGTYNPAVDVDDGFDLDPAKVVDDDTILPADIVRDRFPVPYKGAVYFETIEYQRSKGMDAYGDRGPFAKEKPSPNHDDPTLRSLPHSSIRVYKNGKLVGTAFRNLMAFLPPASVPQGTGARLGLDDGMLGYYPAVASFSGGVAQVNFGPNFWCPPESLRRASDEVDMAMDIVDGGVVKPTSATRQLRGVGERYNEQIVEDILYDIIDEADFFVQDGCTLDNPLLGKVDSAT